jgi:hypothetical protein
VLYPCCFLSVGEALVTEPAHTINLGSADLFMESDLTFFSGQFLRVTFEAAATVAGALDDCVLWR